ncbi:conserved hypothetical protein [Leishmania braziliensis MHOM/BR/75/M2904]|uniref:Uncharacterized protein n=2 Tax=Leishmania braziliensis TaxID=5660 RepID=A4HGH6_LEIBR|nr:conserved hypothetical protein [Leishmania braziliensis MHOM/BR/75/M2904]CAJ2475833.1 unnamed protein product [Leishmania braziliensis]CAM39669.1 conserved hypothetical protein [Leishmania braziliensis MHOM/BR/75/M2904]SYZ67326.1 hypothetical_protein [Leishmania braziliensis MHOM/BR/75/M2904]
MTSRQPTRRLVDVLKQNSKKTLDRHAAQLAAAASSLPAEAIQTRFLRNQFLINPKALQLLSTEEQLTRWHVFGVYKPPFCPMRRAEAADNYHNVSVESFVEAALQSKNIYPLLKRVLKPAEVRVRVLYNLDSFASGPVLISVSDAHHYATSLQTTTMEYDLLVGGHLPVHGTGNRTTIDVAQLFPSPGVSINTGTVPAVVPEAHYVVKENGYYSVHPVSLLHIVIRSPPVSQPPALERFAREQLGTCVMGDPLVMGELMHLRANPAGSSSHTSATSTPKSSDSAERGRGAAEDAGSGSKRDLAAHAAAMKLAANPHIVSWRGDCDFPRVFIHLREVRIDTSAEVPSSTTEAAYVQDTHSMPTGTTMGFMGGHHSGSASPAQHLSEAREIHVHCRRCFDGLLQKQLSASFKSRRIGLLDGSWTPQTEYL